MPKRKKPANRGDTQAPAVKGLRADARRFEFATEALVVFLYDDVNLSRIRELGGAEVVYGARTETTERQAREIEQQGLAVAFELFGDGRVLLDLAVGPPLSDTDQRGADWLAPQLAALSVPSGKLCIDTPDSRRTDPLERADQDPTILTDIPPGEYTVALHRVNWQEIPDDHPFYFVALTNLPPPAERRTYLSIADVGDGLAWLKRWTIDAEGAFDGLVRLVGGTGGLVTNLDAATAAKTLGLRFGSRLSVEIGGKSHDATFIVGWQRQTLHLFGTELSGRFVAPLEATYGIVHTGTTKVIELSPWTTLAAEFRALGEEPVPVRITALPNAVLPLLDASLLTAWTVEGGTLEGRVILASEAAVLLNIPWMAISTIAKWGDALVLTVGDSQRTVLLDTTESKEAIQKAKNAAENAIPGAAALKKKIASIEKKQIAAVDEDFSALFSGPLFEERQKLEAARAALAAPPEIAATFPLVARRLLDIANGEDMIIALEPILGERSELRTAVGAAVVLQKG